MRELFKGIWIKVLVILLQLYDIFFCFQAQRKWEADEEEHKRKKRDYEIRMIEMEEVK